MIMTNTGSRMVSETTLRMTDTDALDTTSTKASRPQAERVDG